MLRCLVKHFLYLALRAFAGILLLMHKHLIERQCLTVGINFREWIKVGGETESVLAAERLKTRCLNHGEKQSVDSKHSAFLKILGKPLGRCRIVAAVFLIHCHAGAFKLLLCLKEIARVSPQPCIGECDHCRTV